MAPKCAFLFPGQGSQAVGMGQDFFEHSAVARELFGAAKARTGIDFEALLFEENDRSKKGQKQPTTPSKAKPSSSRAR